jgi:hypothetical protein
MHLASSAPALARSRHQLPSTTLSPNVAALRCLASPGTCKQQFSRGRCFTPAVPGQSTRSSHGGSITRAAQRQISSDSRSSDDSSHDDEADGSDAADIWTPVPPTPALGRKRKVAVLIAAAMLEITVTGQDSTLLWAVLQHVLLAWILVYCVCVWHSVADAWQFDRGTKASCQTAVGNMWLTALS